MSSTNKTPNLRLNSWIGSDKPKRADFNSDNEIIDSVIGSHIDNEEMHITEIERRCWNSFVRTGMYFGNGSSERTINFECEFDVSLAIIFASNRPFTVSKYSDSRHYTYAACIGKTAGTMGAKFGSNYKSFIVNQSSMAVFENEYASLNESGVAYVYILFR